MKKIISIICLVISVLALVLTGCDPVWDVISSEELENVAVIELINYNNDNVKQAESDNDFCPYEFEKEERLEWLKEEYYEEVKEYIYDFMFWPRTERPHWGLTSAKGISLKITLTDGCFYVVSSIEDAPYSFAAKYDAEGQVIYLFRRMVACIQYINLVNKYFDTKIEVDFN